MLTLAWTCMNVQMAHDAGYQLRVPGYEGTDIQMAMVTLSRTQSISADTIILGVTKLQSVMPQCRVQVNCCRLS